MAAIAAVAVTGCNPTGSSSWEWEEDVLVKSTKMTGGMIVVTEYEWDDATANQTGESQKINGVTTYETTDFEWKLNSSNQETQTRIRTTKITDGEIREKLVTTYANYGSRGRAEIKHEEFLLTGDNADESVPVRYTTTERNDVGNPTDIKRYEGTTMVFRQWDFQYNDQGSGYSYKEQKEGGEETTMYFEVKTRDLYGTILNYNRYSGWNGTEGTLIEKVVYDVSQVAKTYEYTITTYDEEGNNPVETEVEDKYKTITITIES